jgi:hypothetical protein
MSSKSESLFSPPENRIVVKNTNLTFLPTEGTSNQFNRKSALHNWQICLAYHMFRKMWKTYHYNMKDRTSRFRQICFLAWEKMHCNAHNSVHCFSMQFDVLSFKKSANNMCRNLWKEVGQEIRKKYTLDLLPREPSWFRQSLPAMYTEGRKTRREGKKGSHCLCVCR